MGINYFTTWDLFGFLSSWNQEQHYFFLFYFPKGDYPFVFKSWCRLSLIEYVLGNPKHSILAISSKKKEVMEKSEMLPWQFRLWNIFSNSTYFLSILSFTLFGIALAVWNFCFCGSLVKENKQTEEQNLRHNLIYQIR